MRKSFVFAATLMLLSGIACQQGKQKNLDDSANGTDNSDNGSNAVSALNSTTVLGGLSEAVRARVKGTVTYSDDEASLLKELAKTYAPILNFHPKEPYLLSNVSDYLTLSGLKYKDTVVIPAGKISSGGANLLTAKVIEGRTTLTTTGDLINKKFSLYQNTPVDTRGDLTRAVCYARPLFVTPNKDTIDLVYIFFYLYNGHINDQSGSVVSNVTNPLFRYKQTGEHELDFEHLTVRLKQTATIGEFAVDSVFFGAHGLSEGKWYTNVGTDLGDPNTYKLQDGRVMDFVALHTHASYPFAGTVTRNVSGALKVNAGGLSDYVNSTIDSVVNNAVLPPDNTSNDGQKFDCADKLSIFEPQDPSRNGNFWLYYGGTLAEGGQMPNLSFKEWWLGEPVGTREPKK